LIVPIRIGGLDSTSAWQGSVREATGGQPTSMGAGGLLGLLVILVVASFVSNDVAEALGKFSFD